MASVVAMYIAITYVMITIMIKTQGKGTTCKPDQYIANKINF